MMVARKRKDKDVIDTNTNVDIVELGYTPLAELVPDGNIRISTQDLLKEFIVETITSMMMDKYVSKTELYDNIEKMIEITVAKYVRSSDANTITKSEVVITESDVRGSGEFKFAKIRKVKSPERAHDTDAGVDFYIPDNCFESGFYDIKPNERVLIPSGLKVKLPVGHALVMFNKSNIATKLGLITTCDVCDENYMGEIHIGLCNPSSKITRIMNGMKIVQGLLLNVNYIKPIEVTESHLYDGVSTRGTGGFGSTGA